MIENCLYTLTMTILTNETNNEYNSNNKNTIRIYLKMIIVAVTND